MGELRKIDGVTVWTHPDPGRSLSVVTFHVAGVEPQKLHDALYAKDRIVAAARNGKDRPGIRICPHLYNTAEDIERLVAAVRRSSKQA